MQSKKLLLPKPKEVTFEQWVQDVQFSSRCEREEHSHFIRNYQNAKFFYDEQKSRPINQENQKSISNNPNNLHNGGIICNILQYLENIFKA
jgi:hypothetical protein